MNHPSIAKRSACDRCRAQRLRCIRAEAITEPCVRCTRAGAKCITGQPRPLGRPRKAAICGRGSVSSPISVNNFGRQLSQDGDTPSSTDMAVLDDTPFVNPTVDEFDDTNNTAQAARFPLEATSAVHGLANLELPWDTSGLFPSPVEERMPDALLSSAQLGLTSQYQSLSSRNTALHSANMGSCFEDYPGDGHQDLWFGSSNVQQPRPTDPLISLSRLCERVTINRSKMDAFHWDSPVLSRECAESAGMPESNPAAQALLCTEEFVRILQSMPRNSPSSELIPTVSCTQLEDLHAQPQSPSVPTILLILTCYLQLLQLYDSLFSQVRRVLEDISYDALTSMKVKSVVRIGGFPLMQDMQGSLYAQTVVHMIQSHIQMMEHQMGLTPNFCVSDQRAPSNGIFSGLDLAPLLGRVMQQPEISSPSSGISHVESLRDNIKHVLTILRGAATIPPTV
ncbi:hypothetical protein F4677DRAFT_176479 [Hypoxylon crocopeplum]|nr:hypothetical protein F4677DRAFT_176479 [Hypoxylon crocopeplum]